MTAAAMIFSCAAEGDEAAENAVMCFISDPDCIGLVCEMDDEEGGKGKGKGKLDLSFAKSTKIFGFEDSEDEDDMDDAEDDGEDVDMCPGCSEEIGACDDDCEANWEANLDGCS
jgi:hypothetical protein